MHDLVIRDVPQVPDLDKKLSDRFGHSIASCYVCGMPETPDTQIENQDPFGEPSKADHTTDWCFIALGRTISLGEEWAMAADKGLTYIIREIGLNRSLCVTESLSNTKAMNRFVQLLLATLFAVRHSPLGAPNNTYHQRITNPPKKGSEARHFLLRLRLFHVQVFYRPLFSLATSSQADIAVEHLGIVHAITDAVGRAFFWL